MLEKGNFSNVYVENTDKDISQHITDGLTGLLLNGKILNSPLTFCNADMFLIDSARGYGSDEYSTEFRVIGGVKSDDSILEADYGHPSYTTPCANDDDCVGLLTCNVSLFQCNISIDGNYYPTLTEYDG